MCGPAETVMETFQYHPNHSQPSDKHTDKGKQSQNYIQPSQSQEETMKINCIVNDGKLINEDLLLCWSQAAVGQAAAALSCNVFGTSLKGPKFSHGNTPPSTIKATFFLTRHLRCTQIKFLAALLALQGLNNLNGQVPSPYTNGSKRGMAANTSFCSKTTPFQVLVCNFLALLLLLI